MSLYVVITPVAIVMTKPQLISKPLGMLIKDDIIEVLKFYYNWAYFKYNEHDAYIHSYTLAELPTETNQVSSKYNKNNEFSNLLPSMISKDSYYKNSK